MKKVKQISLDILVDEDVDGNILSEKVEKELEAYGYTILGSMYQDDFTEIYERVYPDLLEE